jgi:cold shock CspA family protein
MGETYNKKEKEKNRLRKKQDKAEKMAERKANTKKGKTLEEMMAYLDENGNISSTPPDAHKRKVFKQQESIQPVASGQHTTKEEDPVKTGRVTFFNETKGFGFIKDERTQKDVFLHVSHLSEPVKENDKVTFEVEKGAKGLTAVNVKKATK